MRQSSKVTTEQRRQGNKRTQMQGDKETKG